MRDKVQAYSSAIFSLCLNSGRESAGPPTPSQEDKHENGLVAWLVGWLAGGLVDCYESNAMSGSMIAKSTARQGLQGLCFSKHGHPFEGHIGVCIKTSESLKYGCVLFTGSHFGLVLKGNQRPRFRRGP